MPEPGLAWGLYGLLAKNEEFSGKAIGWALKATDVRQVALVYDWAQASLKENESAALKAKLAKLLSAPPASRRIPVMRDRAFAAVILAGETGKRELESIVKNWWRGEIAPVLKAGKFRYTREESHALFELLHAVRDNTNIDLREDAAKYFKELPAYHILSYYPATFPAPENEYRIPFYEGNGEPDLRVAALSRVTDLSMVAFDTNAQETGSSCAAPSASLTNFSGPTPTSPASATTTCPWPCTSPPPVVSCFAAAGKTTPVGSTSATVKSRCLRKGPAKIAA
jgi:hypothetical protein